ncbi:MAG TPA: N-acetyl-gamma-glutamyl-phosphate reductase [Ruminococcaceae bacterium]|nr:N-acetyl-gamma-glutamyl-phosphate reductase [Oscillospiraceae bacterium]
MKRIFIDGSAGTTGLRIQERLEKRKDLELFVLPDEKRKDPLYRKEAIAQADIAFLCLPDEAAKESAMLAKDSNTVLIDTSTAHRTNPDWAYGFPELSAKHFSAIQNSCRIASPGCHASGFIALVHPLMQANLLKNTAPLSCFSLTGYSGGGKKMIEQYEASERDALLHAPRQYGLTQMHKHLKEMTAQTGIAVPPVFCPVVGDFYSGMQVTVPIHREQLNGATLEQIQETLKAAYNGSMVYYEDCSENGFLNACALSGKDTMAVTAYGNDERMILCAAYDNLGKGASGTAIECMNIKLGLDPSFGLDLSFGGNK